MKEDTILVPVKASEELPDKLEFYILTKVKVSSINAIPVLFGLEDNMQPETKALLHKADYWLKETTKSELLREELEKRMPSDDLKQYMTNLLYYAYEEGRGKEAQEVNRWIEEKVNGIDEYFKSLQPKEPHNLEILDNNHIKNVT